MTERRLLALLLLAVFLPACGDGSTAPPVIPTAPSGLAVTGVTSGRVELAWIDNSTDETGFRIERSFDGVAWSLLATVPADVEDYVDRGLFPLGTLHYRVRTTNGPSSYTLVETASLDGMAWSSPVGGGPSARVGHTLIYDPLNERLVLFGGIDLSGWLADVWVLDLSAPGLGAWSSITPTGTPPQGRYSHTAIYDADGDRMIVFGGTVEIDPGPMPPPPIVGDVWSLSLPASAATPVWTQLSPTGPAPSARFDHSAVLDPGRRRMLVFGGNDGASGLSDLRSLDLTTLVWTDHGAASFLRTQHCAVFDAVNDRMAIHGGNHGTGTSNSTWFAAVPVTGLATWSELPTPTPFARSWASAVYDEQNRRMIVFGGTSAVGSDAFDDVWCLPLGPGGYWQQVGVGSPPDRRFQSSAAYDPQFERMLIFGGWEETWNLPVDDQAYALDFGTP